MQLLIDAVPVELAAGSLGTARKTVATAALERPAVLVVFDLLRLASVSWVSEALDARRSELARLLDQRVPCLQVVDQTDDVELAQAWLTLPNVESVLAKRADRPYVAGRGRDWVKVKRQSVDWVVEGLAGDLAAPKLVLALQHADGRQHHFAVTRPLPADVAGPVSDVAMEASAEEPAIRSRWQHDAVPPLRPVPPRLVCEVRVSNLDAGRWARFPAVFLRWRRDRSAEDCGLDQLSV
jgi:bifunctional non-homologous end joining protein LigD